MGLLNFGSFMDLTAFRNVSLKNRETEGLLRRVRTRDDQRCSCERAPEARGCKKGEGSAAMGKWQNFGRERCSKNVCFWTRGGGSMAWSGFLPWNVKRAGIESPRVHARAGRSCAVAISDVHEVIGRQFRRAFCVWPHLQDEQEQ